MQGLVVVLALTGVLAARRDTSYARTSHFVLHPRSGTSVTDARNAVDVSHQDGPLVQTVLRVLSSDEMRRRAATAAGITDASRYRTSTTVAPGSNFFDVVVTGPAPGPVQRLGNALSEIGPAFVERSYPGFAFDTLGGRDSTIRSFPPGASLLLLAFVLGAVAAVGELFVVFSRQRVPTPDAPEARDPSAPMAAVDRDNGDGNANGNGNGNGNGEAGPPPVPAKPGRARPARRRAPTSR
ncbi:MAG: hypothetical protein QOI55_1864 [Actinomycetota bacterium]|nr:hypothetical protein [Actinomycetota bacterium]